MNLSTEMTATTTAMARSPSPNKSSSEMAEAKKTLNLNSANFDAEYYVQDLLRRKGLEELVAVEQDMVNNVRRLDSEMQSLVYENYSKFLNATSTVREMQTRLADTHNEMRDISSRVQRITDLSDTLTEKFARICEKVKKLNEAKDSVKKLEFLIKAPQILQNFIDHGQFTKLVDAYVAIKPKLEKFGDIHSIAGIAKDVEEIIDKSKGKFHETLDGRLISSEEVIEAVTLLKRLGEPEEQLQTKLLATWDREMHTELAQLEANTNPEKGRFPDIFEFVDTGCCHFLTNVSLMASTFLQLFPKQESKAEFILLLEKVMGKFEQILDGRFQMEMKAAECALFVKALDRIYRKISVLTRLSLGINFTRMNAAIVQRSAKHQIMVCRHSILDSIKRTITELFSRLNYSTPALSSSKSDNGGRTIGPSSGETRHDRKEMLRKILEKLEHSFVHTVKGSLAALLMFTASDIIFLTIPHFSPLFGFDVHQQIIIGSVEDLIEEIGARTKTMIDADGQKQQQESDNKAIEVLILCTLLRNLQLKHLDYLMELCREQYRLSEYQLAEQHKLSTSSEMVKKMKETIEDQLRKLVKIESDIFIQLVKKSIEAFDWANCAESPRRVRTLIKHLVQSVETADKDLAIFMEDDGLAKLKERTPDSLRGPNYSTMRRATSAASSVYNDASSVSSGGIVERLWGDSETTEENVGGNGSVETAETVPVDYRRDVIMNAIVRLTLNGMCEFVRGQKFSRQGLEQMQVDCAFMRQKLWTCVGDEHMLNMSIEDVVTAAVNQCAQPKLLDPSVVRNICEEN